MKKKPTLKRVKKITLRLEQNGQYIEKRISCAMICALFDLQFMLDEAWDTIELNKIDIDKDLAKFFGKPDWKRK